MVRPTDKVTTGSNSKPDTVYRMVPPSITLSEFLPAF